MIHEATRRIQAKLEEDNLKCQVYDREDTSWLEIQIGTDQFTLEINFFSSDEDPDVSVRVIDFIKGNAGKRDALINTCNDLNNRFRYAKFLVDADSCVRIDYDFPIKTPMSAVGEVAKECISRFLSISKKAYPELMKTLWA